MCGIQGLGRLPDVLFSFAEPVAESARQHLAFPELHYFHARDRRSAIHVAVVILDELLTVIQCGAADPIDPAVARTVRSAVTDYLDTSKMSADFAEEPQRPTQDTLQRIGIQAVPTELFEERIDKLRERRCRLQALLVSSGWTWDDANASPS